MTRQMAWRPEDVEDPPYSLAEELLASVLFAAGVLLILVLTGLGSVPS